MEYIVIRLTVATLMGYTSCVGLQKQTTFCKVGAGVYMFVSH